jgi:hypothetical protein
MEPSRKKTLARVVLGIGFAAIAVMTPGPRARAASIPPGWSGSHVTAVGYTDLDGHGGAFKMAIKQVNGRWYLYLGHLWHRGWSIVDVTDPTNPRPVKFIPGPDNTWTIQMEVHENLMLTALQDVSASWGGDPKKPFDEGVLIWDISDPVNPKQLSHWKTGSTGVHRIGYPGGRYANLAANMPGYKDQIIVFLDVSDPAAPKEAGRWWMPGQKDGEPPAAQPASFHGPAVIDGNTAYLGYSPSAVVLDISDITHPKLKGKLDVVPPFGGLSVHDVLPLPGKNVAYVHGEALGQTGCTSAMVLSGMLDITDPGKLRLISILPRPQPPSGAPFSDFCDKGGRSGPHNVSLEYHLPDVQKQGDLLWLTYFNAGVRGYDIKDPRNPKEVAWFIPPTPPKRLGPLPADKLVTQTEDVLVDTRGNIYLTDKQWGLWIVRHTPEGVASSADARQ